MNLIKLPSCLLLVLNDGTRLERSFQSETEQEAFFNTASTLFESGNSEKLTELFVKGSLRLLDKEASNIYFETLDCSTQEEFLDLLSTQKDLEFFRSQVYLRNTKSRVPLPPELVKEIINSDSPTNLINFWKRASANPDSHITNRVYDFVKNCGLRILENGCFVAFRGNVPVKKGSNSQIPENLDYFVNVIKSRKKGLSTYVWDKNNYEILPVTKRRLSAGMPTIFELQQLKNSGNALTRFTDKFTKTMDIRLGSIVSIDRALCDNDPNRACSHGLHLGTYNFGVSSYGVVTACICDPFSVVSIPYADSSKLRTCMYFPFAVVEGNISEFTYEENQIMSDFDNEITMLLSDIEDRELSSEEQAFIRNYALSYNLEDIISTMGLGSQIKLDGNVVINTIKNRFVKQQYA